MQAAMLQLNPASVDASCPHSLLCLVAVHAVCGIFRVKWEETDTLTENYQVNKFVLDPNEGFGRNKREQPLKSKEQREAEDEETFSDDDGGF